MGKKLSSGKRRSALAAIRRGSTVEAAAAHAGVCSAVVSRWVKEEGLELGSRKKSNKVRKLLEAGKLSVAEIAIKAGVSRVTVYSLRKKLSQTE